MSNLDRSPTATTCAPGGAGADAPVVLPFREVPLGGPRAMPVRRSLPQRSRSLIGAWCFVDHYGPDDASATGGMAVPGHPHTGLATASWLFAGEVEHRDTTGAHAVVRPGELNLMTAGSGIAHSEYSTATTTVLHGAQLWIALPDAHRFTAPAFQHYAPPTTDVHGAQVRVFLGSLFGQSAPVPTFTPLVGAEVVLGPGEVLEFDVDPGHEHGLLCDTGTVAAAAAVARPGEIAFVPAGGSCLRAVAGESGPARFLVLGGAPLGEEIVMWWNFVGRSHAEIEQFRADWERERTSPAPGGRYGQFPDVWSRTLPAPELPKARLRSRR